MSRTILRAALIAALIGVPTPAPTWAQTVQPVSIEQYRGPTSARQTILEAEGTFQKPIQVVLNGRPVSPKAFELLKFTDVSALVKPGLNTVRVTRASDGPFRLKFAYAETPGAFRRLVTFNFSGAQIERQYGKAAREFSFEFVVPGSAQHDDPRGGRTRLGSGSAQTVLTLDSPSAVKVYFNGRYAGMRQSGETVDVSNFVHAGQNTLRVVAIKRDHLTGYRAIVAHAEAANNFKTVFQDLASQRELETRGEKTYTFTVPE